MGGHLVLSKVQQLEATAAGLHSAPDLPVAGPVLLPAQGRGQAEVRVLPQPLVPLLHICLGCLGLQHCSSKVEDAVAKRNGKGPNARPGHLHTDTSKQWGNRWTKWTPACFMLAVGNVSEMKLA